MKNETKMDEYEFEKLKYKYRTKSVLAAIETQRKSPSNFGSDPEKLSELQRKCPINFQKCNSDFGHLTGFPVKKCVFISTALKVCWLL